MRAMDAASNEHAISSAAVERKENLRTVPNNNCDQGHRHKNSSDCGKNRIGRFSSVISRTRVQIGDYALGKTLGIGSFGKVKLAEHVVTGQLVAIKILNRAKIHSLNMEEKVNREVQILKLFVHPHIIRLYEVIETPTDVFLVMEYVAGGELFDYIVSKSKLHLDEARQFFQQIVSGVAYCHANNVVHRDLKPENLLLSGDYNIKVADFGLSNLMYDGEFLRTSCGSPNYAAPEVISGLLYAGPEVDIWSCGVILFALLCGSLPFDDESIPRLFRKIRGGHYALPSHLDDASRDLILRMLIVDPTHRIKINEIRSHPFFVIGLPPYLSLPISQQSSHVDPSEQLNEEAVSEIMKLKHRYIQTNGHADVIRAIQSKRKNFIQVIYYLYLDQFQSRQRVAEQRACSQVYNSKDEMNFAFSSPKERTSAPEMLREFRGNQQSSNSMGYYDGKSTTDHGAVNSSVLRNTAGGVSSVPNKGMTFFFKTGTSSVPSGSALRGSNSHSVVGSHQGTTDRGRMRKWYLGIQSKKDPECVMTEVFRALRSLHSQWHYVPSQPYRVSCRWRPSCLGIRDPNVPDEWIYVSLQLYKVQKSIYLLDFQRGGSINGCFSFMRLCSLIINALKASPSSSSTGLANSTSQSLTT